MEKSNNTGKIVGAILMGAAIGGVIGAALGILFAPEKGSETRKRILATGEDLKGAFANKFKGNVEEIENEVGPVREKVSELVSGIAKTDKLN